MVETPDALEQDKIRCLWSHHELSSECPVCLQVGFQGQVAVLHLSVVEPILSLPWAFPRPLALSVPPAETRTPTAKTSEIIACNQPHLNIHLNSGWSLLPSWTFSKEHWTRCGVGFWRRFMGGLPFLFHQGVHTGQGPFGNYSVTGTHLQGPRLLMYVTVTSPHILCQALS